MIKRILMMLGTWSSLTAAAVAAPSPDAGTAQVQTNASSHAVSAPRAWAAWPSAFAQHGVEISGSMTGLWIGDVAGGMRQGGVYNTLGFLSAQSDLAKLTGWWQGGRAFVNGAWIRGGSVSSSFVGDALVVSNLDGFDSIRLYQAWLEQGFFGDHASLRAGVLSADEEFCGTDGGAMFTSSGFGWNAGIGGNVVNGGPIYYAPGLGVRLEAHPVKGWTVRTGAYDGDSFDSPDGDPDPNQHGLHFRLSRAQGAFLIGEVQHAWNEEGDAAQPGTFRLGAWRHTADFADNLRDAQGGSFAITGLEPANHHGNHGVYGVFEQKLWNESGDAAQGPCFWTRLAAAPADRSAFSWVSEAGVHWTGIVPGRTADMLGVGIVTAYVSPDAQQSVRDANSVDGGGRVVPDFERAVEMGYQVHIGDHWVVTPGVQWVQHPGTTTEIPNAIVSGLRVTRQ